MSTGTCKIPDCGRKVFARGWCGPHHYRASEYGDPLGGRPIYEPRTKPCAVEGCERLAGGGGYCKGHLQRIAREGQPGGPFPPRPAWGPRCTVPGCGKRHYAKGLCGKHYTRQAKYGDVDTSHARRQAPTCSKDGCTAGTEGGARDLCKHHYRQVRRTEEDFIERQRARSRKHWLKQYGLTIEDYNALTESQDDRCAICRADEPGRRGRWNNWYVDHDHVTGKARGLLCHHCNVLLGMAKDDVTILQAAIAYLERPISSL